MIERCIPLTKPADHEIPIFEEPKRWTTVAEFIADFRADLIERYRSPTVNTVISIAFASMQDIENAIRWFRYKPHPWQYTDRLQAIVLYTKSGIPELWIHRDEPNYARIYIVFLEEALGIANAASQLKGLQIDHAFGRIRAHRKGVGQYMLLSPIPQRSNSSHGYGEYVTSLDSSMPKHVTNADPVTFAKLMGWLAPKLSAKAVGGALEMIEELKRAGAINDDDDAFLLLVEDRLQRLRETSARLQVERRQRKKRA